MNARAKYGFLAMLLIFALVGVARAEDEKVSIKLSLKQGQIFKLRLTTTNVGRATVGKTVVNNTESAVVGLVFSVESLDEDGTAHLKVTFDRPSYSLSGTGQTGSDQVSAVVGSAFAALHGQSFSMELTPTGVVKSVTGLAGATSAALQTLSGKPQMVQMIASLALKQAFADAAWREAMSGVFSVIPPSPVAIGERWSRQFSVGGEGAAQSGESFMKILSRENGVAKIKVFTNIKSLQRQPVPGMTINLTGTSDGVVSVEEATGLIADGSDKSNLKGNGTAPDGKPFSLVASSSNRIERY